MDETFDNKSLNLPPLVKAFLDPLVPGEYISSGFAKLLRLEEALVAEAEGRGRKAGRDSFHLVITSLGLVFCRPSIGFAIAAKWNELTLKTIAVQDEVLVDLEQSDFAKNHVGAVLLTVEWPEHGDLQFITSSELRKEVCAEWLERQPVKRSTTFETRAESKSKAKAKAKPPAPQHRLGAMPAIASAKSSLISATKRSVSKSLAPKPLSASARSKLAAAPERRPAKRKPHGGFSERSSSKSSKSRGNQSLRETFSSKVYFNEPKLDSEQTKPAPLTQQIAITTGDTTADPEKPILTELDQWLRTPDPNPKSKPKPIQKVWGEERSGESPETEVWPFDNAGPVENVAAGSNIESLARITSEHPIAPTTLDPPQQQAIAGLGTRVARPSRMLRYGEIIDIYRFIPPMFRPQFVGEPALPELETLTPTKVAVATSTGSVLDVLWAPLMVLLGIAGVMIVANFDGEVVDTATETGEPVNAATFDQQRFVSSAANGPTIGSSTRVTVVDLVEAEPLTVTLSETSRLCHSNYTGCVSAEATCDSPGLSGRGTAVRVLGEDVLGLDSDNNGLACD